MRLTSGVVGARGYWRPELLAPWLAGAPERLIAGVPERRNSFMTTREVIVPVNTAKVLLSALIKAGALPRIAEHPEQLQGAVRVVAPCEALCEALAAAPAGHWTAGHRAVLRARIAAGRPTLTIASCAAFMLSPTTPAAMVESSQRLAAATQPATTQPATTTSTSPSTAPPTTLSTAPSAVSSAVSSLAEPPAMSLAPGWSQIEPFPGSRFIRPGWAYFESWGWFNGHQPSADGRSAPSELRADSIGGPGWSVARQAPAAAAPAAFERGSVLLCLFRPDLSSQWGQQLLQRWLAAD